MKIYLPGEIKEEHRGDSVLLVTLESPIEYGCYLYRPGDEEIIALTGGPRAMSHPVERVYWGVRIKTGEQIIGRVRGIHPSDANPNFESIDSMVVTSRAIMLRRD